MKYFSKDYLDWKLSLLQKINFLFIFLFTLFHGIFVFPEVIINQSTLGKVSLNIFLRLFPLLAMGLNFNLNKNKIVYSIINNLIMVSSLTSSGILYILGYNIDLNLLLSAGIIIIVSTLFTLPIFSIFDFIVSLFVIVLKPSLTIILIILGMISIILSFLTDKYFFKMYEYINRLKKMATEDTLTKLYNRGILKEKICDRTSTYCQYSGTMIMVDIDHFKKINDNFGHQTGDIALCRLAAVFNENVRKDDYVIRFGGEEFLIIFKDLTINETAVIAERIRKQVEELEFQPPFTISCGIASFKQNDRFELITKKADEKLYEAKTTGRNKVCY